MDLRAWLGTEHALIQAPMAGAQGSAMAIAVCNAGALGSLPTAMLGPEGLGAELPVLRAGNARPLNSNFFCGDAPVPDPDHGARWRPRARAEAADRGDFSPLWSGQNRSGCAEVGAAELTRRLAAAFR